MKKGILKKLLCVILGCGCMLASMLPVQAAEPFEIIGDVKPSDKAYNMILTDATYSTIRNEKEVDLDKFYNESKYTLDSGFLHLDVGLIK